MNRTILTRTARTTVLAGAAAALALTLTACGGDGSGTKDEGAAAKTTNSTAGATSTDSKTGDTASADTTASGTSGSGSGTAQAGATKKSPGKQGTGTSAAPECRTASLSYTLTRRFPEQQGDHLLITAVNKSGSACTVQKFPVVTPGDANGDVPLSKKDEQPAQPILVKAGGTVYSALPVYQDIKAEDDYFTSIRLSLQMNDVDNSSGVVTLKTPGEVEYAGKKADGIEVLSWNTKKPYDF
ncbi:DUF4232 domain-containing protein [Streptomyces sp. VRA16 Mangrove soil]|uniref:DUF4232 domain-containing protein n=1 Tax=Streptomyces sp. VRA16 Mangrove soil TaxID=2817434 RepID=UPI001A9F08D5|nr:DUF4232 domain-containing protein [Streptomyces sp. VRA16 Mangrove soil]MBO1333552.1 DUF4232 domain-containing protein [Streptomyces sp. VRA16 Mangrove soil]